MLFILKRTGVIMIIKHSDLKSPNVESWVTVNPQISYYKICAHVWYSTSKNLAIFFMEFLRTGCWLGGVKDRLLVLRRGILDNRRCNLQVLLVSQPYEREVSQCVWLNLLAYNYPSLVYLNQDNRTICHFATVGMFTVWLLCIYFYSSL